MAAAIEAVLGPLVFTTLLLSARLLPLVVLLPVFGGLRASPSVRLGVLVCLVVACFPSEPVGVPASAVSAVQLFAFQLAFGLISASCALFVFEAARMAGSLADVALGRGSFGAGDPIGGSDAQGPMSTLHALAFLAVFVAVGAHLALIAGVAAGLEVFPLTADNVAWSRSVDVVVSVAAGAIAAALAFALPALAVGVVVDISLGWLSRSLPQLPVMFIAMPARMVLGWFVVATTLSFLVAWLSTEMAAVVAAVHAAVAP